MFRCAQHDNVSASRSKEDAAELHRSRRFDDVCGVDAEFFHDLVARRLIGYGMSPGVVAVIPRLAQRAEGPPSRRKNHASPLPRATKLLLTNELFVACVAQPACEVPRRLRGSG
jgi:hypothetical protein